MMVAAADERMQMIADMVPPPHTLLPARLSVSELRELAHEPLADIGAHAWSHRGIGWPFRRRTTT